MKRKLQIFISSTYEDLKDERQAAVSSILKAGHIPAGMELFTSGDETQMQTIKRWIDDSDIYLLILGGRYGSVEKTTSLSYTELEYDYAVESEKPFFSVVIDEKALEEKVKIRGSEVLEREHPKELNLFREKVLSKTSSFFEDSKDIKLAVHETVSDFIARYELNGWVPGYDIPDTQPLLDEIKHLRKENNDLVEQSKLLTDRLKKTKGNGTTDEEFTELVKILQNITIETDLSSKNGEKREIPLINFLTTFRDDLVTGVTNQIGVTEMTKLLYFNVCPKLQIHGLAINEKVASVQWRRFSLTQKGEMLLAYLDKKEIKA